MEAIQYAGLDLLNDQERSTLDTLSAEYYDKLQRTLQNELTLKVHIKTINDKHEEGKAREFSIHVQCIAPTRIFESSAEDWDFARVLHKVFKDLELQLEHKMSADNQHRG